MRRSSRSPTASYPAPPGSRRCGDAPLTQVRAWATRHLADAAREWTRSADTREHTFTQLAQRVGNPGGTQWHGATAESAQQRASGDRIIVVGFVDQLHRAAGTAIAGADQIDAAKAAVLQAVSDAQRDGFTVGHDFSVSSNESGSRGYLSARQAKVELHARAINAALRELVATDSRVAGRVEEAAAGLGAVTFAESDTGVLPESPPAPPRAGQPVDPTDPYVGNENLGHWENVGPPPRYVGVTPPPLTAEHRPFRDDLPIRTGPSTGMYTPGKTWLNDEDEPIIHAQEAYSFRIAGTRATTTTRMVKPNGRWQQQRWAANVYEAKRHSAAVWGNDLAGLGQAQEFNQPWKPISLTEISRLSARNAGTTYYLPDGCGGTVEFNAGVADGKVPTVPVMTRPR